ncbi:site-specific DNA-methyltransferase [Empedobacter falsenii]
MAERMNNLNGKEWLQNSFSVWRDIRKSKEEISLKHPALFPSQLVEKLINIFTKDDGEVILDPFLGIGSTLIGSFKTNRSGIGCELNSEFAEVCKARINNLKQELFEENSFEQNVLIGDNRETLKTIASESVDLSISSPPYWDILNRKRTADNKDIINYSDSSADIGNIEDYNEFINSLKEVYSEVYRTLKFNKRCVINVMDLRKKDKFFPLHIDITRAMGEIGFELEDIIIWDRQHEYNNMKTLGYPWVFRVNKVHEYLLIFWKRNPEKPKRVKKDK